MTAENPAHIESEPEKELLPPPEITIEKDEGTLWGSFLEKAYDPTWGDAQNRHPFAQATARYFEAHPLSDDLKRRIAELRDRADDEVRYWFSLALDHPERKQTILHQIEEHKEIKDAPDLLEKYLAALGELRNAHAALGDRTKKLVAEDIDERRANKEKYESQIAKVVSFFRPARDTTDLKRISLPQTNFLLPQTSGRSALIAEDAGIVSFHPDNDISFAHEVSHFFVNPAVEKLDISKEEADVILRQARSSLAEDYVYPESVLQETIIRTYTQYVAEGEEYSLAAFEKKIGAMTNEKIRQMLSSAAGRDKELLEHLGVKTPADAREKAQDIYNANRDILGERMYVLLKNYEREKDTSPTATFERYLTEHFSELVAEKQ
jgi:hypothetical protein